MKKIITLTHEQANLLSCYILLTTQYRKEEVESWKSLSAEKNLDGTPLFENAASNATWWSELEGRLTEIREIIDNSKLLD